MAGETINSRGTLRAWLNDKPTAWAQVIAARAALRVLPLITQAGDEWLSSYAIMVIRANAISWAAPYGPSDDIIYAAKSARDAADKAEDAARAAAYPDAADAAATAWTAAKVAAYPDTADTAAVVYAASNPLEIWESVNADCRFFNYSNVRPASARRHLSRAPLWQDDQPINIGHSWAMLVRKLLTINSDYSVWIEWYERRIRGESAAFDIPGDKGYVEDKKILRRLAEATDEDFWGKGHEYVNATLKSWLDEARVRVALPPITAEASGTFDISGDAAGTLGPLPLIAPPPQEAGAIAYGVNSDGKLDRLPHADQVHLRDVLNQRRAYADIRDVATELSEEGQRLGLPLQRGLDRFNISLPERFEDAEAYLVWRDGNALRRLYLAHRKVENSLDPDPARLEPLVAESLGGLLDLFNNFAFADDGLRAKDEQRIPTQERPDAELEANVARSIEVAMLATPEIATDQAMDDIKADVDNAMLPFDDVYTAQALDQSNKAKRNRFSALLSWARNSLPDPATGRGVIAYGIATNVIFAAGQAAIPALGASSILMFEFIATNASIFSDYVAIAYPNFPQLPTLIDQIKHMWNRIKR